jgi:uncharacterized protein YjbI with pentapeptide repeats
LVGAVAASQLLDCEFRDTRLRETGFTKATFKRVRFEKIQGNRVMWRECSFNDVRASGRIDIPHLIDCDFHETDLSGLHLVEGTLMGAKANDVVLPSFDDSFLVLTTELAQALDAELAGMVPSSQEGLARLRDENVLQARIEGARDIFWSADLLASIFQIHPADAERLVERLRPHRLTRLPA